MDAPSVVPIMTYNLPTGIRHITGADVLIDARVLISSNALINVTALINVKLTVSKYILLIEQRITYYRNAKMRQIIQKQLSYMKFRHQSMSQEWGLNCCDFCTYYSHILANLSADPMPMLINNEHSTSMEIDTDQPQILNDQHKKILLDFYSMIQRLKEFMIEFERDYEKQCLHIALHWRTCIFPPV